MGSSSGKFYIDEEFSKGHAPYMARTNDGNKKMAPKRSYSEENDETFVQATTSRMSTQLKPSSKFEEKVLEELSFLRDKVFSIEKKVALKKSKRAHLYEAPEGMPMETMEDFTAFEEGDETRHEALQEYLEYLGGANTRDALNGFIRVSMTSKLAQNYTWFGKNVNGVQKGSLYKTKLMRIFFDTLQKKGPLRLDEFVHHMNEVLRSYKQTGKSGKSENSGRRERKLQDMEQHFQD